MSTTEPKLVRIPTGPLANPKAAAPKRPISGDARFNGMKVFEGRGGKVRAGVWESTSGMFRADTTGYIEYGHIVEGDCRIVDPDGTVHTLNVGDPFIMPEGYKGRWEIDTFVKKVYMVAETA